MTKLLPDERLLIESGTNNYQLLGPGRVWIKPWQRVLVKLYVGPQGQSLSFNEVRTVENIPVNISMQLLYRVDPALFTGDLLPKLPGLNEGGWQEVLRWRTEHVLRQMLANYAWRELGHQTMQPRLERQLTQTLADYLKRIGLNIASACLVKIELPIALQKTIIQAERDGIEPRGRASVLKEYFDIFGHDLAQAMPYIVQWEVLNTLQKSDKAHLLLTSSVSIPDEPSPRHQPPQPVFQMQLPLPREG
jgi:hypothetical protein